MVWVRRTIFLVVAVLIVAGVVYALLPKPVAVDLATVDRGPIEVTVDEEGIARIREVYEVSAPLAGQLERFPLDVGDVVRRDVSVVARDTPRGAFLPRRPLAPRIGGRRRLCGKPP